MHARFVSAALSALALILVAATPARASLVIELPLSFEFSEISLEGTGSVPLGENWAYVPATLGISTSATFPSLLMGGLEVEYGLDDLGQIASIDRFNYNLTASLFLDLTFTEVDSGNGFGGGLGPVIHLPASADKPLELTVDLSATPLQLSEIVAYLSSSPNPGATVQEAVQDYNANNTDQITWNLTDSDVAYALNANLGGGTSNDIIKYSGAGVMQATLEGIVTSDTLQMTGGTIDGVSLAFAGDILDESDDPPLSVDVSGSITLTPVPAPASVLLLALGLAGMGARRMLRRTA